MEIAATGDMKKRMRDISVEMPIQSPKEISEFLRKDLALNAELVKAANIKLE